MTQLAARSSRTLGLRVLAIASVPFVSSLPACGGEVASRTSGTSGASGSGGSSGASGASGSAGNAGSSGTAGVAGTAGVGGASQCAPTFNGVEVCDGIDNDCNGVIDDGNANDSCGGGSCFDGQCHYVGVGGSAGAAGSSGTGGSGGSTGTPVECIFGGDLPCPLPTDPTLPQTLLDVAKSNGSAPTYVCSLSVLDGPTYTDGMCCYDVQFFECGVGRPMTVSNQMRFAQPVGRSDWN